MTIVTISTGLSFRGATAICPRLRHQSAQRCSVAHDEHRSRAAGALDEMSRSFASSLLGDVRQRFVMLAAQQSTESLAQPWIREHARDVHRGSTVLVVRRRVRGDSHPPRSLGLRATRLEQCVAICRTNFFVRLRQARTEARVLSGVTTTHERRSLYVRAFTGSPWRFCATLRCHGASRLFRFDFQLLERWRPSPWRRWVVSPCRSTASRWRRRGLLRSQRPSCSRGFCAHQTRSKRRPT